MDPGTSGLGAELRALVSTLSRHYRSQRPRGEVGDAALVVLLRLHRDGPQTLTTLSARLGVTPASLSQSIVRLVERGYAERARDEVDRRRVLLRATPRGVEVAGAARARMDAWFAGRLDALTAEERHRLESVLPVLRKLADPDG